MDWLGVVEFGELKPLIKTLVLPPAPFLWLPLLGLAVGLLWRGLGRFLIAVSFLGFWLLSTSVSSDWLGRLLLPSYPPLAVSDLKARGVEAIIVVGGGLQIDTPEYDYLAQPGQYTMPRLRYGVWLAKQSRLPLGYTGGVAWGGKPGTPSEGEVAQRVLQQDYGMSLRWIEKESRDTAENGRLMGALLRRDGIRRVALVTHHFHMHRTLLAFADSGLELVPAPIGRYRSQHDSILHWLPSASALDSSYLILYEWLGLQAARFSSAKALKS